MDGRIVPNKQVFDNAYSEQKRLRRVKDNDDMYDIW